MATEAWAPYALPFLPAGKGRNVTLILHRPMFRHNGAAELIVTDDQTTLADMTLTASQAREIAEQLLRLAQMQEDGVA